MRNLIALFLLLCGLAAAGPRYHVQATAYCQQGKTADGSRSRVRTAAADPGFLPMGTRIRVTGAGRYSGIYTITDTGSKIQGRRIDLRLPTPAAARKFGRKRVRIQVLE